MIQQKEMELDDSIFNLGDVFTEGERGFYLMQKPNREMSYVNLYQNAITYEMSLDKHVHSRRVYSFFDWSADIGGLFGAVTATCGFILFIFHKDS